jgi:hypothetical protein
MQQCYVLRRQVTGHRQQSSEKCDGKGAASPSAPSTTRDSPAFSASSASRRLLYIQHVIKQSNQECTCAKQTKSCRNTGKPIHQQDRESTTVTRPAFETYSSSVISSLIQLLCETIVQQRGHTARGGRRTEVRPTVFPILWRLCLLRQVVPAARGLLCGRPQSTLPSACPAHPYGNRHIAWGNRGAPTRTHTSESDVKLDMAIAACNVSRMVHA